MHAATRLSRTVGPKERARQTTWDMTAAMRLDAQPWAACVCVWLAGSVPGGSILTHGQNDTQKKFSANDELSVCVRMFHGVCGRSATGTTTSLSRSILVKPTSGAEVPARAMSKAMSQQHSHTSLLIRLAAKAGGVGLGIHTLMRAGR
eukprot:362822-Chlamydomonas_euryale.AAC.17